MHSAAHNMRGMGQKRITKELTERVAKPEVQKKFGTYATQYDSVAVVQRRIADRLVAKYLLPQLLGDAQRSLQKIKCKVHGEIPSNVKIFDAGAGTGYLGRALRAALVISPTVTPNSVEIVVDVDVDVDQQHITDLSSAKELLNHQLELTAFDLAPEMLLMTEQQGGYQNFIEGDIEQIENHFLDSPIPFDFTMSSLAVQWCHSLKQALIGLQQVTRKRVFVTTLLDGTLQELESAFKQVDDQQHILPFVSFEEANHIVGELGGEIIHYEEVIQFPTLKALFKSLRSIGASALPARRKGLMGRNDFLKIDRYFQQLGSYQLTYRVAEIILPGINER